MNICNTFLEQSFFYHPLGFTPPVSLTQDLPPEQDADILLLGCGDARHVLFTCFADDARKIDVTCCDINSLIHARNVLLFTLLIDDQTNCNIEHIWNIYYHWKLDGISMNLLKSQTHKLLQVSESVDKWNSSNYGSSIRFCDERSLSSVRCDWLAFASEEKHLLDQMQAEMDVAKARREVRLAEFKDTGGYPSALLVAPKRKAREGVAEVSRQWWDSGIVPSNSTSASKHTHLNPLFLYQPTSMRTLFHRLSSVSGFHLSTAYTPINQKSPFYLSSSATPAEHLVNCAKSHFTQWASAFRKAVANRSVFRIFSGDSLSFCLTLRHRQLTGSVSMNVPCHNWTFSPLILHNSDYGLHNSAPLSFDVVDATNLMDTFGLLNILALGSILLKYHVYSCLYIDLYMWPKFNLVNWLYAHCGANVHCVSLLFGLLLPELYTNATEGSLTHKKFSRLCWKRLGGNEAACKPPYIQLGATELAKLLIQIHDTMFHLDDPSRSSFLRQNSFSELEKHDLKTYALPHNRAGFAFLLSIIKINVVSNWDECLKVVHDGIISSASFGPIKNTFLTELAFNLHIFGVDDRMFSKPDPAVLLNPIIASILPKCDDLPDQLCVTMRIFRSPLREVASRSLALPLFCSFETRDAHGNTIYHSFSSVQVAFGEWCQQTKENEAHPFIKEDSTMSSGTSDFFASVIVPTSMLTSMLLQSEIFVPRVRFGLKYVSLYSQDFLEESEPEFFIRTHELTSQHVFITRYMPGMSGPPTFSIARNDQDMKTVNPTVVHLSSDGSKVNSLIKRVTLESEAAKTKLAMKSTSVEVKFPSPLAAVVSIAGSFEFKLNFPVPVSAVNMKVKVARKSSYIEVETCLFDPIKDDDPTFLFPCFLTKVSRSLIPVPWTLRRVNVKAMPQLYLDGTQGLPGSFLYSWLHRHVSQMFSVRDYTNLHMNQAGMVQSPVIMNFLAFFKQGLLNIFRFCAGGYQDQKMNYFWIGMGERMHTIVFPSSLRLDLANNTVVLDCALIPLTKESDKDPSMDWLQHELHIDGSFQIMVSEAGSLTWKAMMPSLVECCRTWEHTPECEYIKAGQVPLPQALLDDRESPICSCGIGKFPKGYLKKRRNEHSTLISVLKRYATRAAISPIFPFPYVEKCSNNLFIYVAENCKKCGKGCRVDDEGDPQALLVCSRCKSVKYCSNDCQKADWKEHKTSCKTA